MGREMGKEEAKGGGGGEGEHEKWGKEMKVG